MMAQLPGAAWPAGAARCRPSSTRSSPRWRGPSPTASRRRTSAPSAAAFAFFGIDPKTGQAFVAQSIEGGGWGGRPSEDGPSASVSICQGDVRNSPIEALELRFPIRVEERALREDSGGAGQASRRAGHGDRDYQPGRGLLAAVHGRPAPRPAVGPVGRPRRTARRSRAAAAGRRVRAGQRPGSGRRGLGCADLHRWWRRLGSAAGTPGRRNWPKTCGGATSARRPRPPSTASCSTRPASPT